jgi:hypothetical protein
MKKKLIVLFAVVLTIALGVTVSAATKKATLINEDGDKVVVAAGSSEAQYYFGQGFVLMGADSNPVVSEPVVRPDLGATSGTTHTFPETFTGGISFGAALATSTSGSGTTLKESELNKYSMIAMTSNVSAFTYTLPATSTLSTLLKNPGDSRTWTFINATTTVATTLTVAKGTGWNLTGVDANTDVIAGAAWGSQVNMTLNCTRQLDKDILCRITENIAVD